MMIRDGFYRKSTSSDTGDCVEVAAIPGGGIHVRDSKDRDGGHIAVSDGTWRAFTEAIKAGRFPLAS